MMKILYTTIGIFTTGSAYRYGALSWIASQTPVVANTVASTVASTASTVASAAYEHPYVSVPLAAASAAASAAAVLAPQTTKATIKKGKAAINSVVDTTSSTGKAIVNNTLSTGKAVINTASSVLGAVGNPKETLDKLKRTVTDRFTTKQEAPTGGGGPNDIPIFQVILQTKFELLNNCAFVANGI